MITLRGSGGRALAYGHLVVDVGALRRGGGRPRPRRLGARWPPTSSSVVGDGASLTFVSVQDWADDAVHVGHARSPARPRRHAAARRGDPRRRPGPDQRHRATTPARAATPSCSGCTSPTPASTWSTGCSSTTTRRTAGSHVTTRARCRASGAHTVWIGDVLIRAAPRAPTPTSSTATWCSPTAPGRLGAQPGDRDRRDRRRRPRQRHRPVRRRAAVLPAGPRHPRGRGPPAGRARLLRRRHQPDRRPRAARPADGDVEAELERNVGLPPASSTAVPVSPAASSPEVGA